MKHFDFFTPLGTWQQVKRAALTTIHKAPKDPEPPDAWKKWMLLAEHSPIRKLRYEWRWAWLMSWVSTHFVRHYVGWLHYVSTQRTDRTGIDRSQLSQSEPVWHESEANAQSLISASRKRLCRHCPSPETRQAWEHVIEELAKHDPLLASVCVPECIYRGFCPELQHGCGYAETDAYLARLKAYRSECND